MDVTCSVRYVSWPITEFEPVGSVSAISMCNVSSLGRGPVPRKEQSWCAVTRVTEVENEAQEENGCSTVLSTRPVLNLATLSEMFQSFACILISVSELGTYVYHSFGDLDRRSKS